MNNYFMYLCGGMSNLPMEEQNEWRNEIRNELEEGE